MTDKKRTLLEEMAKVREEERLADESPQEPVAITPPPSASATTASSPLRAPRNATPLDHAKAYADLKKADLKQKRRRRWLRFFNGED